MANQHDKQFKLDAVQWINVSKVDNKKTTLQLD